MLNLYPMIKYAFRKKIEELIKINEKLESDNIRIINSIEFCHI